MKDRRERITTAGRSNRFNKEGAGPTGGYKFFSERDFVSEKTETSVGKEILQEGEEMTEREKVLQRLDALGIAYELTEHKEVFTIEEMEKEGICDKGTVCKNFFLRDYKGKRHFLVVLDKDRQLEIQSIRGEINSSRLSFASEERLKEHLKLRPGAVGPFALLNDGEKKVELVLDAGLEGNPRLGFHPNDNRATLWISYEDLLRYIEDTGHSFVKLK